MEMMVTLYVSSFSNPMYSQITYKIVFCLFVYLFVYLITFNISVFLKPCSMDCVTTDHRQH